MTLAPPPTRPPRPAKPQQQRMTLAEYYALDGQPAYENVKTELLAGRLIVMPLPHEEHNIGVMSSADFCREIFPSHSVREEKGFFIPPDSDIGPDVAVVDGPSRQYSAKNRPRSAYLIIEVANTSLATDTGEKAELYAKAGVQDYWVLDLTNRRLFVFRSPIIDADREHGHWYASVQIFDESQSVAPLAAPSEQVPVRDLLP